VRKTTVSQPVILTPVDNPHPSQEGVLNLTGTCETGDTISLSGGGSGSTTCAGSAFSIPLPKATDGDYAIIVSQSDPAGNVAFRTVTWQKHALAFAPPNPSLVVATGQNFTVTGGSNSYTLTLQTNNSGATLSGTTYTAGHLANVVDTILVT